MSIPRQQLYLYRHGILMGVSLMGVSSVSTGKRGYGTPAGIFTVLEKDRFHRSRTYNNALMPYANRLTWDGVSDGQGEFIASNGEKYVGTFKNDRFQWDMGNNFHE